MDLEKTEDAPLFAYRLMGMKYWTDSHRRNLIRQFDELGMNGSSKHKHLANMEHTLKQIQEQFHFFNTGHKLKLEG